MTIEGQRFVSCTVPCSDLHVTEDRDGIRFDFEEASLYVKGGMSLKLRRRINEARKKHCGEVRIVLQFPSYNKGKPK